MKYLIAILIFVSFTGDLYAQKPTAQKTKFIIGLSGPELLHAGVTYRVANSSQLGISLGAGPSLGSIWPTVNLEHRLYFGENSEETNQKTWFFRQGTTFFPSADPPQKFTMNLTVGKDFLFKKAGNGITIDAGVFYLPDSANSSIILVSSLNLWPALRFEFFF